MGAGWIMIDAWSMLGSGCRLCRWQLARAREARSPDAVGGRFLRAHGCVYGCVRVRVCACRSAVCVRSRPIDLFFVLLLLDVPRCVSWSVSRCVSLAVSLTARKRCVHRLCAVSLAVSLAVLSAVSFAVSLCCRQAAAWGVWWRVRTAVGGLGSRQRTAWAVGVGSRRRVRGQQSAADGLGSRQPSAVGLCVGSGRRPRGEARAGWRWLAAGRAHCRRGPVGIVVVGAAIGLSGGGARPALRASGRSSSSPSAPAAACSGWGLPAGGLRAAGASAATSARGAGRGGWGFRGPSPLRGPLPKAPATSSVPPLLALTAAGAPVALYQAASRQPPALCALASGPPVPPPPVQPRRARPGAAARIAVSPATAATAADSPAAKESASPPARGEEPEAAASGSAGVGVLNFTKSCRCRCRCLCLCRVFFVP